MGLDPLGLEFESYSVPEVSEEVRQQTGPSFRLAISSASGKLKIKVPSAPSLSEVAERARVLGDKVVLSKADMNVIALALDLSREGKSPIIVSDDYAVQNVADALNLVYQSLATLGIRERFDWVYYCPACFRRYATGDFEVCQVCGTKLKRKPLNKRLANRRRN
jgi:UPF0271 protein